MAKSRKLEELQARLNEIREQPITEAAALSLSEILQSKHSVAIAQAAKIIREAELRTLIPELVAAFERLMHNPSTSDPNCIGKKAIAEALYRLDCREEDVFLKGIRHVQMEPVWGGQMDTAPGLRSICALGLVRMNYLDAMTELADLLADPEPEARIGAVRALIYSENPQAVPLLRLRVRIGDDASVLSECFSGLLRMTPEQSLPLVASFLNHTNPQLSEMAALALGESRLLEALPILQDWWKRTRDVELRQTGLLAIAMLRHEKAIDFLLSLITEGTEQNTQAAIIALRIYQDDQELSRRIEEIILNSQNS